MDTSVYLLRRKVFSTHWPLDDGITTASATLASHRFLENPSGQYLYVYLTRFVKAMCEKRFGCPFAEISVLDWGCGKGHVSKLLRDLGPRAVESCDIVTEKDDSAFGQETPIIKRFEIQVTPLRHEYMLPYADSTFDAVLSVGVLEHVPNDRASLLEIKRVLRPGGLFFCFFLPTTLAWTQRLAHLCGNYYHDRFYNKDIVKEMLNSAGVDLLDIWYRQILPKNTVRYPLFRFFERADQIVTEYSPFGPFATNVEFVAAKPN